MNQRKYSYERERDYYSHAWPVSAPSHAHLDPYLRCWLNPVEVFSGKRVLDIGAGDTAYTCLIAERYGPKEIVACEIFRERMLPASSANRNPALQFVAGDCFQLPFQTGSFDIVFGSLVLHQLPDLDAVIKEIRRVLRDSGMYIGIEPNSLHPVHLVRYFMGRHSSNQYLLSAENLRVFEKFGFDLSIEYFYAKLPSLHNRLIASCMGVKARRKRVHIQAKSNGLGFASATLDQVEQMTQLHIEAYPDTLLSKLGHDIVRGYFAALLTDVNCVGWVVLDSSSGCLLGYCIGLLSGDRMTKYFWGQNRLKTGLKISVCVLGTPSIWMKSIIQMFGWFVQPIRHLVRGRPDEEKSESGIGVLVDIACDAGCRGKGLGRTMMEEWEREMVRRGCRSLKLFVRADNNPAIHLYESLGWTIARPLQNIQRPGHLMTKTLQ